MDKATLLVVDDEEVLLELFTRKLERLTYRVYQAGSGVEALEILQRGEIDVLITDFKMPGMNGAEIISRAIEIDPMLQSIVVTGYSDLTTAIDVMGAGAFNYLPKPIDFKELDIIIQKGLEKRKLLKEVQNQQRQLDEHRELLEELVEKRTRALTATNQILEKEIEERKRLEISLLEAKVIAENASKAKSEFLANMSHEIRTPMTSAIGLLNLVLDTELLPKQKTYLEMARISTVVMNNLLNDILDFSKIEAGKLNLESITFDPGKVIGSVIDLQHLHANEKDIKLSSVIDDDVPCSVVGDPNRLRQIVLNLVSNAIKFTQYGEVTIRCKCAAKENQDSALEEKYKFLHFSVQDSGVGIDKDKIQLIFEAFTQADNSTTRKFGGVGLGLNICKKLVEMMGGCIWVVSEPGQGSTFNFTCRFGRAGGSIGVTGDNMVENHTRISVLRDDNTLILEKEIFSEIDALKKSSGNKKLMIERLHAFLQKTPGTIETLRKIIVADNGAPLEQEVHRLNERAMEIGATNFADELFSLLMNLRKNKPVGETQIDILETEFDNYRNEKRIQTLTGEGK